MTALPNETTSGTFEETLQRARSGSEDAWQEIYDSYSPRVLGYFRCTGSSEPDERTSETFLKIAQNIHWFTGDESDFQSWLFLIAHRVSMNAPKAPSAPALSDDADLDQVALQIGTADRASAVLRLLSDDERNVLSLRVVAALSLDQTAAAMGKRVGAVRGLQPQALTVVKANIEDGRSSL